MTERSLHAINTNAHSRDMAERMSFVTRALLFLFARRLNREVCSRVIARAYERGQINSRQPHELCREFDPTQAGAVGLASGHASRIFAASDHASEAGIR